jgi:hypothetical protein
MPHSLSPMRGTLRRVQRVPGSVRCLGVDLLKGRTMDEPAEYRTDRELAAAGGQRAKLRLEAAEWIESKGISRCPLCKFGSRAIPISSP